MDQFKQISTFIEVAHRGSLTAAARAQGIAAAMIGRRLDALEARLGIKLLRRTTRRIVLTHEGASFLEDCQRILGELADAEAAVSAGSVVASGHLFVSAPAGFGRQHLAPLIPSFLMHHPALRLTLDLTDRLVDLVSENVDVAIRIGEQPDSSLIGVRLAENRRVVCGSPMYFARHGRPLRPADLLGHHCLTLGPHSAQQRGWTFQVAGQSQMVKVGGGMACNDGSVLHRWAVEGHGLAWRSLWEVGDDLKQGRLIAVLEEFEVPGPDILAVFPQRRHLPVRLRTFVDHLKSVYASSGYWG
ncbi:MAG: LysR family transcriptional regulator [Burkholderiaceae bacterium]|jgi:DNA-binding transcriptional LysR family regulator